MPNGQISPRDRDLLKSGYPPENDEMLDFLTVGQTIWEDFIKEHYIGPGGYIADGHSQLKIVLGRPGSGKTHLLRRLGRLAVQLGYVTVPLSVTSFAFQHINSLYTAVAEHIDFAGLARRLADRIVDQMGYHPAEVPADKTFIRWLVDDRGRDQSRVRREIFDASENIFKRERTVPDFSLALTQMAATALGAQQLDEQDRAILLRWFRGDRLRVEELRRIHLARPIDRFNAREMLHALSAFIRRQGYTGLFITIDKMEELAIGRKETGGFNYGSVALADAYQSLREMIDSLPSIPGLLIVLAGRPDFLERPRGIKSYDALWLRIQHEVVSPQFNKFAQVIDLDKAIRFGLKFDDVLALHEKLSSVGTAPVLPDKSFIDDIVNIGGDEGIFRRLIIYMTSSNNVGGY